MSDRPASALKRLARLYDVQLQYRDYTGASRHASATATRAILRALGAALDDTTASIVDALRIRESELRDRMLEPVVVAWSGRLSSFRIRLAREDAARPIRYELYLEDGTVHTGTLAARRSDTQVSGYVDLEATLPIEIPLGYHDLAIETGSHRAHARIISAPTRPTADAERGKGWGIFVPTYSLRSDETIGIGDFGALEMLMHWAGDRGADFVGTLPLLATFLRQPFEPSPYSPVSRLFWNEIFLDLRAASTEFHCAEALRVLQSQEFARELPELNAGDNIDYARVAEAKRRVLSPLADCFFAGEGTQRPEWQRFLLENPRAEAYAVFRAITERRQQGWSTWPADLRHGNITPAEYDAADYRYHLFAQYLATHQLRALSHTAVTRDVRLYLDVPLGVHAEGFDIWCEPELFARGVSAGAPPDAFFTLGQRWGFPPINPTALRESGYEYFIQAIRNHLRYAGALRLDHVMWLHRLFWVPDGMEATDGVYVRYPTEELYAVLALEAERHDAIIVGEDLGTVPGVVRRTMKQHAVRRMYVVQFEAQPDREDPLPRVPRESVASLNTHDMPAFEAFREGLDADLREELGLIDSDEVRAVHRERRALLKELLGQVRRSGVPTRGREVVHVLLEYLARSPAELVLVNLEDLWREKRPQNVPGTGIERPNWRRRAAFSLESIMAAEDLTLPLQRIDEARRDS